MLIGELFNRTRDMLAFLADDAEPKSRSWKSKEDRELVRACIDSTQQQADTIIKEGIFNQHQIDILNELRKQLEVPEVEKIDSVGTSARDLKVNHQWDYRGAQDRVQSKVLGFQMPVEASLNLQNLIRYMLQAFKNSNYKLLFYGPSIYGLMNQNQIQLSVDFQPADMVSMSSNSVIIEVLKDIKSFLIVNGHL